MVITSDTLMSSDLKDRLLEELRTMPAHQVCFKHLIPQGWTIPFLCDLLIDPDDAARLPGPVLVELQTLLKPEWVLARRAERASLVVAEALQSLQTTLVGLPEAISQALQPATLQPAQTPRSSRRQAAS